MKRFLTILLGLLLWAGPTLAQITVNTTADNETAGDGSCTLREALNNSNDDTDTTSGDCAAGSGTDTIGFSIPGGGVQTIQPTSLLPFGSDPVIIDGLTQPGASCASWPPTLLIEIDGTNAGVDAEGLGVVGGSTVRGLVINRYAFDAISLLPPGGSTVECNFLGTNPSGTAAYVNGGDAVIAYPGSTDNTIGGTSPSSRNLIGGFNAGINLNGSDNQVWGNYIGTDVTGTSALSNSVGVLLFGSGNQIGGTDHDPGVCNRACNLISGNVSSGIRTSSAFGGGNGNTVEGNFIGTDITGILPLGGLFGVSLAGTEDTIGGAAAGAGNVISANSRFGIRVESSTTGPTTIQGNYIGTTATGNAAVGNGEAGISTEVGNARIEDNVVSGNEGVGVDIRDVAGANIVVVGNYIGLGADGQTPVPNAFSNAILDGTGIRLEDTSGVQIGGSAAGDGNVISNNEGGGISLLEACTGNTIQGNKIGTDAGGTLDRGNAFYGINLGGLMASSTANNLIGGTSTSEGNIIAFNATDGVVFSAGDGNTVRGNMIFQNGGVGIDLGGSGVLNDATPNDAGDADAGPNNLQNFPEINMGTALNTASSGGMVTIDYTVPSATANSAYPLQIEFFLADADDEEGQTFLGSDTYPAASAGVSKTVMLTPPVTVSVGDRIVATATDANGNTSEFSAPALLSPNLPVELVAFNAIVDGPDVVLQWNTATETDNAGFEVEIASVGNDGDRPLQESAQTTSAKEWQTVHFINGHGTTLEPQSYTYRLSDLDPGTYRFRLKQLDFDGAFAYSPEVEITLEVPGTHVLSEVYPNPFNTQATFTLAVARAQHVEVSVYDVTGRQVRELHDGLLAAQRPHRLVLDGAGLPNGLYLIRVTGEGFEGTQRVLRIR